MVPVIIQFRIGSLHLSEKSAHLVSILSILEHIIIRLQQVLEIELFRSTTNHTRANSIHIEIAKKLPDVSVFCN